MRTPKYLSYSSLTCFEEDTDEWVIRYLVDNRPEREAQGKPAGVGSAFDARVKAHMYEFTYGPGYMPEKYSYEALFEKQVEPHNRDFCGPAGDYVFECYRIAGFLDRLESMASRSIVPPQYEFRVEMEVGGVPLLGLPDGYLRLPVEDSKEESLGVVLDFKVNGFCSNSAVSPNQGFLLINDGYKAAKQSRSHGTTHKNAEPRDYKGITIGGYLEDSSEQWASQLTGYAWCLGEPIGSEDVVMMIHQVVAKPIPDSRPLLRFAEFCGPVRQPFQDFLLTRYQRCWNAIMDGHVFKTMTKEESDAQFRMINRQADAMVNNPDPLFNELVRPTWRGK